MSGDATIPLQGDLVYLLPTAPSFWQWSADGQWVEWADGRTIAHRDELLAVLARLAPRGLPRMEAIVLILSATKPQWGHDRIDLIARTCAADAELPSVVDAVLGRSLRVEAASALQRLDGIAALPAELKSSAAAKASLVDFVFDRDRVVSPATAEGIVRGMRRGVDPDFLRQRDPADGLKRLANALHTLDHALGRGGDAVELWQRTGIDFDLAAADIALPPGRQTRELLRTLRDDDELGGLARVAADVLAAMRVPKALSPAHDPPAGGVSDLSNKGGLDQLLVSELAHDDLTLAVRVATGEALYRRREPPARRPPVGRFVVIDSGIRLWGTARLFATAVGLAVAAGGDEPAALRVYRAGGPTPEPVSFATRDGVASHLARLLASPDPLPAVRAAAQACGEETDAGGRAELIVVTHEQTAAGPGFLAALSAIVTGRLTLRLATVTADGSFSMSTVLATGRTELTRAKLSVERLSGAAKPIVRPTLVSDDASVPVILRLKRFPLYLPARVQPGVAAYAASTGVIGLSTDRRLMRWDRSDRGAEELCAALPAGIVQAVLVDDAGGRVHVIVDDRHDGRFVLFTLDLNTADGRSRDFKTGTGTLRHATLHGSTVLIVGDRDVLTLPPSADAFGGYVVPADMTWHCGRFFKSEGGDVYAAAPAELARVGPANDGLLFFDYDTVGPVRLRAKRTVESFADGRAVGVPGFEAGDVDAATAAASADGHRLVVHEPNRAWVGFDLDTGQSHRFPTRDVAHLFLMGKAAERALSGATRCQLQRRATAIARRADGGLVLRPGSTPRPFALGEDGTLCLTHVPPGGDRSYTLKRPFDPVVGPAGSTTQLQKAEWDDGSTAWLDARGLLHLMSSDPQSPQITIVLRAGTERLAGWLSTGEWFGDAWFTGRIAQVGDRAVWGMLRQFGDRLR